MIDKLISSVSRTTFVLMVILTVVILIAKGFTLITIEKALQRIVK